MRAIKTPQRQKGHSLVATLVGVVISLATVGAMLTTYRLTGDASVVTTQEMNRDGQVLLALQVLEMEVQQSGFGTNVGGSADNDVWVSADGKRMAWRYKPSLSSAAVSCKGIEIVSTATERKQQGVYGYAVNNCATASGTGLWAVAPTTIASGSAFFTQQGEKGGLSLADAVFVKGTSSSCAPYGDTRSHMTVSLTAQGTTLFSSCLSNITL